MFKSYAEEGPALLTDSTGAEKIRATFVLENSSTTIANTLRRCILTETRSVGFRGDLTSPADKGITIRKNTSQIFNEMLAHRLTLLPLGIRMIDDFEPARYECVLTVKNDKKGPITPASMVHVTAGDFLVREKDAAGHFRDLTSAATTALFPADPITKQTSLLLTLRPQWNPEQPPEEIDLTAIPVVGRGREFMGFSPVSQCSFANTLDTDPVTQDAHFKQWLLDFKKLSGAAVTELPPETLESHRQEWSNMAIQRCFLRDERGEPYSFTFTVESVGIRPVPDIVLEGIRAAAALVAPYTDSTRPAAELGMTIQPAAARLTGVDVIFQDQEHTLGNLLQTLITEQYLSEATETADGPITSVAYKVPHPLERKMFIRLGFRESGSVASGRDMATVAREIIATAAQRAQAIFDDLARAWETSVSGRPVGGRPSGRAGAASALDE